MSNDIEALPKLSESILDDELDKKDSKGDESDDRVEAGNPKHAREGLEDRREHLNRALSARQVQMIAIAGTIGTGLFLGTGKSLAKGGPASLLIAYSIVGAVILEVMLCLGEMATQYPVAGSFNSYASRFVDPALGFALSWNYWFNDAVSLASDLTAAQLLLAYWTDFPGWVVSLIFFVFLLGVNFIHVRAYGELEYWLALLKVITILIFIIIGILVNVGVNHDHQYIGGRNWHIGDAPFVGGIGGFASVFVTASFAYGGTESIGITAGETKNPTKTMPRVIKNVFFRILLFYVLSVLLIGLNVPYNTPGLSTKTSTTSPFTLVFQQIGSTVAASFINAVVLTSVLSAGNHALYAGTRVLYSLSVNRQAPSIFRRLTPTGVPWVSLIATSSISILCFGSSFIGAGDLWNWLQNIVGVSNQIAWVCIGVASWRFRQAWKAQGRDPSELKFRNRTWPFGPPIVIVFVSFMILIQGWDCFKGVFDAVSFVSYYIELPVFFVMFVAWKVIKRTKLQALKDIDLVSDEFHEPAPDVGEEEEKGAGGKILGSKRFRLPRWLRDIVSYIF